MSRVVGAVSEKTLQHVLTPEQARTRYSRASLNAEIVEVEIEVVSPSIVPSGSLSELKSHCHLYGAQGQRQAYLLPMPR
ncbi:hypothetical protein TNCV_35931 [Trichonephila clavipes]|nr:hypothetical protein TNCV_35931 [Trichonephila clavipes]